MDFRPPQFGSGGVCRGVADTMLIAHLLAGLILLTRVYVPLSATLLGTWPARLVLFFLWFAFAATSDGAGVTRSVRTLAQRRGELLCYALWLAVVGLFWLVQGGAYVLTEAHLNHYIAAFFFYVLGVYYSVAEASGRRMAMVMLVATGLSCLQSIPVVWRNPELARAMIVDPMWEYRALGVGGYAECTAFALLLSFFIAVAMQSKHLWRAVGIACCVSVIGLELISTFSGVILLTGMAVVGSVSYYLILRGFRLSQIVLTIGVTLVIGLVFAYSFPRIYENEAFGKYFDKLANLYSITPRILSGEETDPTDRFSLMVVSLQAFVENPIVGVGLNAFGTSTPGVGGHSSWIDAFALYGVVGGLAYLLFHLLALRRIWRAWCRDRQDILLWGCLFTCALGVFYGFFNVVSEVTTASLLMYVMAAGDGRKAPAGAAWKSRLYPSRGARAGLGRLPKSKPSGATGA